MAVKKYKATTNGRRNMSVLTFEEITTSTPEKSLLAPIARTGGRNTKVKQRLDTSVEELKENTVLLILKEIKIISLVK